MAQFQIGDVVQLKSGGPKMTIMKLGNYAGFSMGPENGAACVWFDGTKKQEEVFDVAVLEKVQTT